MMLFLSTGRWKKTEAEAVGVLQFFAVNWKHFGRKTHEERNLFIKPENVIWVKSSSRNGKG